jgi:hypothetical protein
LTHMLLRRGDLKKSLRTKPESLASVNTNPPITLEVETGNE